jgi:hypothetical protein
LASSSATFAQSRKYSTGRRSPLTSKSAKRAMISHAKSIAYCSIFARASVGQSASAGLTHEASGSEIVQLRLFLLMVSSQLELTMKNIPLWRLVRSYHIHLSRRLINQTLFIPYTLNLPLARSDRPQFPTPHPRHCFLGKETFQLGIRRPENQVSEAKQ